MSDVATAGTATPSSLRNERPADDSPPAIQNLDSIVEAEPEPAPPAEPEYLPEPPAVEF